MIIKETGIEGLLVIEPRIFEDSRGYFYESYRKEKLEAEGVRVNFVQDNQSRSSKGVIRGLHYQKQPHAQTKLVRAVEGSVFDVAVDIRPGSPTYGKWFGVELNAVNHLQLLIPRGFAHGFSVLSAFATVLYKCDAYYNAGAETGIRYDDPDLRIDWKIGKDSAIISGKDKELPYFKDI